MLQMMRYGKATDTDGLSANAVLRKDLPPANRCISKFVALQNGAAQQLMEEWEQSQSLNNTVPFPLNRLMPPKAIFYDDPSNPFAELYDDKVLEADWNREGIDSTNPKQDSWKAGYSYKLLSITFNDPSQESQYGPMSSVTNGSQTIYTRGWIKIVVNNDDGSHDKYTADGYYYWKSDDGYANIGSIIQCYDMDGFNYGLDRYVVLQWEATPITGIVDYASDTFKCVQPDRTHTEFETQFYHHGNSTVVEGAWASYDMSNTPTISISHSSNPDIAVILPGLSTNGTYWDSNGWHHASQSSQLENAISVSGSTVTINSSILKQVADANSGEMEFPIYIYGCWDAMRSGGTADGHLIADSGSTTTVSCSGMNNLTLTIKAAGNLLKTEEDTSIISYYTCLYKVHWKTNLQTINIMPLSGSDSAYSNVGGVYGLIYPTLNFVRSTNQNDKQREYIGDASLVQNGNATINVSSTVNGSSVQYIVSQYFPAQSPSYNETYTINGQYTLGLNDTVTLDGSSFTVNFGSTIPSSGRWLKLQQVGSPEHAELSFTFS